VLINEEVRPVSGRCAGPGRADQGRRTGEL